MSHGIFTPPKAINETVKSYAPDSTERKEVLAQYQKMYATKMTIPLYIGNQQIVTSILNNPVAIFERKSLSVTMPIGSSFSTTIIAPTFFLVIISAMLLAGVEGVQVMIFLEYLTG